MKKSQSLRHHHATRPSLALSPDDLGVLREGNETNEDVLRKQLLERDRECDRVCSYFSTRFGISIIS